jgi:hypothetical protein
MKSLKVAFYKGNSVYSKLIEWWTNSLFSHVELILDDRWVTSYPGVGVRINKGPTDMDKYVIIDITNDLFKFVYEDTQQTKYNNIDIFLNNYIKNQYGSQYDWMGIVLSQFIKLGINSDTKWFCSEFVTKLLQILLYEPVMDLQPNKVSPGYLYDIITKNQ